MTHETTRREMLQHLRSGYGGLREHLESWEPQDAERVGLIGAWSAHQLVAHAVAWEEEALERVRLIAAGKRDQIRSIKRAEVDAWNAVAVERLGPVPWRELLARWAQVRAELVRALEALPAEQLDPTGGRFPVSRWLPDFTWRHEAEHAQELSPHPPS